MSIKLNQNWEPWNENALHIRAFQQNLFMGNTDIHLFYVNKDLSLIYKAGKVYNKKLWTVEALILGHRHMDKYELHTTSFLISKESLIIYTKT
jgi:hypothetical protein